MMKEKERQKVGGGGGLEGGRKEVSFSWLAGEVFPIATAGLAVHHSCPNWTDCTHPC